jgi:hypothetical protein
MSGSTISLVSGFGLVGLLLYGEIQITQATKAPAVSSVRVLVKPAARELLTPETTSLSFLNRLTSFGRDLIISLS